MLTLSQRQRREKKLLYVQLAFIIPSTIEKHNPGAKGSEGGK